MRASIPLVALVLAGALAPPGTAAGQRGAGAAPRQRPPEGFACAPDRLTSYTGMVVRYTRQTGSTTLRITTDWDTTEQVTLSHPGTDDPSAQFRFAGRPFTAANWPRVERSKGVLHARMRASAWVCSDGKVMVDWAVPLEER